MRTSIICVLAALAAGISAAAGVAAAIADNPWQGTSESYYDPIAPNRNLVFSAQVGTPSDRNTQTTLVATPDGLRAHVSGWRTIDLKPYGVPADARFAVLAFKALFTKGAHSYTLSVYAYARKPGAACCVGPPGFENYPTDSHTDGGQVVQTVSEHGRDADRTWSPGYTVPLVNGTFELSWGYRRYAREDGYEPPWPEGDAVGVNAFLNGWGR